MTAKAFDHNEVTCEAMWDVVLATLPAGTPRYCCVCEGHHCPEAMEERMRAGLPPPPADAWCKYIAPNAPHEGRTAALSPGVPLDAVAGPREER
jgi:hypothetical protein